MNDLTTKLAEALREIVDAADGTGWNQMDAGFSKAREALRLYDASKAQPAQDLPPLPEPDGTISAVTPEGEDYEVSVWREGKLHDYARAGYIAGLEAAASAIEPKCIPEDWTEYAGDCASLARVIRNLKGKA